MNDMKMKTNHLFKKKNQPIFLIQNRLHLRIKIIEVTFTNNETFSAKLEN